MFWNSGFKESQYLFPFFRFILGVTLFQAAINAVPSRFPFLVFDSVLFIDGKVPLGVEDTALTLIALYFSL
jgi:hypothetical protein